MAIKLSEKELHEQCVVPVPKGSHFTIYNLPFGIFRTSGRSAGVGMAIGQYILDLRVLADSGLFRGLTSKIHFESDSLNSLMSQGPAVADGIRRKVQALLTGELQGFSLIRDQALVREREAAMLLPFLPGNYTDFYSSEEHATNVGRLFRSKENALLPNWKHLPVGYHGRASSVISTHTPVVRPNGQKLDPATGQPVFGPSSKLDFELELAYAIGMESNLGVPVPAGAAEDHIFGFVLMNDWSARDIQQWEYQPLGPFLGKSFATSISPWVVTASALEPFRCKGPEQKPKVLPYLRVKGPRNYDIRLQVELKTREGFVKKLTDTNSRYLYWCAAQQIAHHTVNGCNLKIGDLMASGTISGPGRDGWGSLLEQTFNGTEPVKIHQDVERTFLEDGDTVTMTGWAGEGAYKVGFGELSNRLDPAPDIVND